PAILPILSGLGTPVVLTAHDYKLACPAYKMFSRGEVCERCQSGALRPLLRRRCIHGSTLASSLVAAETALHRALGSYRRHVDRIVCPSRFMVDKLIEWGWPPERLVHLRNFVDLTRWPAAPGAGGHLLYHGRLAPEKGLETLVRAATAARSPLRIVGSGVMEAPLRRLADELDAPVVFVGHQPEAAIPAEIRAARAVVTPSEWYENASLACLEAMACAKPVIATRIGGNPEIVTDGETGWLIAPGDANALAERLAAVMAEPDHRLRAIGLAGRAFVARWHGPDDYFEATTALYRSLGARV
ncbi:MAG: glycosyltransferase family 4 protein, partial [Gammaproteobacteria bacterium]|nr:glycosyltransferase family 4 protein [Gammaproteobacteria bacterium]